MSEHKISDLKIHPTILKNNGYAKYSDALKRNEETYVESWQKCVRNEHGEAYFINFNFSDMTFYYSRTGQDCNPYSWEADLQFHDHEDDMTVNVKIYSSNKCLQEVEAFCERMFNKMNFRNYEYYSEATENAHFQEIKFAQTAEEVVKLDESLPKPSESSKRKNKL